MIYNIIQRNTFDIVVGCSTVAFFYTNVWQTSRYQDVSMVDHSLDGTSSIDHNTL